MSSTGRSYMNSGPGMLSLNNIFEKNAVTQALLLFCMFLKS